MDFTNLAENMIQRVLQRGFQGVPRESKNTIVWSLLKHLYSSSFSRSVFAFCEPSPLFKRFYMLKTVCDRFDNLAADARVLDLSSSLWSWGVMCRTEFGQCGHHVCCKSNKKLSVDWRGEPFRQQCTNMISAETQFSMQGVASIISELSHLKNLIEFNFSFGYMCVLSCSNNWLLEKSFPIILSVIVLKSLRTLRLCNAQSTLGTLWTVDWRSLLWSVSLAFEPTVCAVFTSTTTTLGIEVLCFSWLSYVLTAPLSSCLCETTTSATLAFTASSLSSVFLQTFLLWTFVIIPSSNPRPSRCSTRWTRKSFFLRRIRPFRRSVLPRLFVTNHFATCAWSSSCWNACCACRTSRNSLLAFLTNSSSTPLSRITVGVWHDFDG